MSEQSEYVAALAERIRAGRAPSELGSVAIARTLGAWREDDRREDAQVVIDAFPRDFPSLGKRGAD